MPPEVVYLEAIKRSVMLTFGPRQATRRRILEHAISTLQGEEFEPADLRKAFERVCPARVGVYDQVEAENIEQCFWHYSHLNAKQRQAA
ncbi:MAG: hypothetical protein AAGB19_04710 [Cyanobacteria bacterium P01_F01_bin.3]